MSPFMGSIRTSVTDLDDDARSYQNDDDPEGDDSRKGLIPLKLYRRPRQPGAYAAGAGSYSANPFWLPGGRWCPYVGREVSGCQCRTARQSQGDQAMEECNDHRPNAVDRAYWSPP